MIIRFPTGHFLFASSLFSFKDQARQAEWVSLVQSIYCLSVCLSVCHLSSFWAHIYCLHIYTLLCTVQTWLVVHLWRQCFNVWFVCAVEMILLTYLLTDKFSCFPSVWLSCLIGVCSNIKCQRKTFLCPQGDAECLYAPLSYSTNFISFPSRIHIPADLFTMRGPLSPYRRLAFDLKLIKAEDPRTGQQRISRSHFSVKQATLHYRIIKILFMYLLAAFVFYGWPPLLTFGFSGNSALLLLVLNCHDCCLFESSKYLLLLLLLLLAILSVAQWRLFHTCD